MIFLNELLFDQHTHDMNTLKESCLDTFKAQKLTAFFLEKMELATKESVAKASRYSKERRLTGKKYESILTALSRVEGVMYHYKGGSGLKSWLLAVVLENGDKNPRMGYKEKLIFASVICFSMKHPQPEKVTFSISHHCFQRMLERLDHDLTNKEKITLQDLRKIFFDEMALIPIMSSVTFSLKVLLAMVKIGEETVSPSTVIKVLSKINIPIPTPKGLLLAEHLGGHLHVKTYVSDDMLNTNQRILKDLIMEMLNPIKDSKFIYFLYFHNLFKENELIFMRMVTSALSLRFVTILEDTRFNLLKSQTEDEKKRIASIFRLIKIQSDHRTVNENILTGFYTSINSQGVQEATKYYEKLIFKTARSI